MAAVLAPLEPEVDHVRGDPGGRVILEYGGTPTLFIDGVVHRGPYDADSLLEEVSLR